MKPQRSVWPAAARISSPWSIAALVMLTACSAPRGRFIREADYRPPIRVACVGDSITYGYGIPNREQDSYPAQLAALLGEKWVVRNFGVNGATALKQGTRPYPLQPAYNDTVAFQPDVLILELGTNDTTAQNWPEHKQQFAADYADLVTAFSRLASKPRLYLCRPPPLFRDRGKPYDTDKVLVEEIIPRINLVAQTAHLPVIDLYARFEGQAPRLFDGVHPDKLGARMLAETIYARLLGRPAIEKQER